MKLINKIISHLVFYQLLWSLFFSPSPISFSYPNRSSSSALGIHQTVFLFPGRPQSFPFLRRSQRYAIEGDQDQDCVHR